MSLISKSLTLIANIFKSVWNEVIINRFLQTKILLILKYMHKSYQLL